jgi:hypothetical protein
MSGTKDPSANTPAPRAEGGVEEEAPASPAAAAVRDNTWQRISDVAPGLRALPLEVLVAQLAGRRCLPRGIGWGAFYVMKDALALLASRADPPAALFAAARALIEARARADWERGRPEDARQVCETPAAPLLAVAAARRALHLGEPVTRDLEELVAFPRVVEHPPLARALLDVLRALPRERVLTWTLDQLCSTGAAVVALGAHFDEALLREALRGDVAVVPEALELIGAPALPALRRAMADLRGEQAAAAGHALVLALAEGARAGAAPPEDYDADLLVGAFDGRPMERQAYGAHLREATELLLASMPAPRRTALVFAALEAAPMSVAFMLPSIESDAELDGYMRVSIRTGNLQDTVIRDLGARAVGPLRRHGKEARHPAWVRAAAFGGLSRAQFAQVAEVFEPGTRWRAVKDDVARAVAAAPDAPRVRVYLLEPGGFEAPAREGSASRIGGSARGVRKAETPKSAEGYAQTHVLTLDLDDAPELRLRFPDARAVALFCPSPTDGEALEDSALVAIPADRAKPRSGTGSEGEPLAVLGIDVPLPVFEEPADALPPPLRALRERIHGAGGHVLGRPFWIHDKPYDGDDEGFVLQINEGLNDLLNLGDGSLYVFTEAVFAQCP